MNGTAQNRRHTARLHCVWKEGRIEEWNATVEPHGPRAGGAAVAVAVALPPPAPLPPLPSASPSDSAAVRRPSPPPIVLLTDFGTRDAYVGVMKGVLAGLAPDVPIIDLTHDVPPQDVRTAAFLLAGSVAYFPEGTIFVAVVDPGVGTARKLVAVRTERHRFLAPDNGLLGFLKTAGVIRSQHEVTNAKYFLPEVSATFHARDILAPVAAHLARGTDPALLGPVLAELRTLDFPRPAVRDNRIEGEVVYIDSFGNCLTNLTRTDLEALSRDRSSIRVSAAGRAMAGIQSTYGSVEEGSPVALVGSSGHLEIAIHCGHAARAFDLALGAPVTVTKA